MDLSTEDLQKEENLKQKNAVINVGKSLEDANVINADHAKIKLGSLPSHILKN